MEELSEIKKTDNIIYLGDKCNLNSMRNEYEMYNSAKIITFEDFMNENFPDESQDYVVSAVHFEPITPEIISKSIKILKPNGKIFVAEFKSPLENLDFVLKTTGFVNIKEGNSICCASKPNYKIGSAARLNLQNPASSTVWKLDDDAEDKNDETIDPDELLDEDDLKKPDPSSLRVCGTTGQRKACKDCSCGLADELAAEAQSGKVVDTANAPKSSCGSCYLGDAFRCATCPYLGMPAFKPGEKIQLEGNLLQDDL